MPAIFEDQRSVVASEIDLMGHVNNIEYLRWTQRAAVRHSDAQGWTTEDYLRLRQGWLVRSHHIEYRQPALMGDVVIIRTWVADMKKVTSLRRFQILRSTDQALLAEASTNWAFVNFQTGTLCRIPTEVSSAFEIVLDAQT
ncbi:MAG: acyl-CoA thioesterase YbgC [Planctomycetaceae bacterium]|nr:acyl-CoA thioesterase YbgC [Planctomycetaceae bacterium]